MNIIKEIDRYLLHQWEWSSNELEEKFWLDCNREFLFTLRKMRKTGVYSENLPIWNSFFELIKTFKF